MTRTRGRGPRGRRVVCRVPHGHWKTVSTVAAMTAAGVLTAVLLPENGKSATAVALIGAAYLVTGAVYLRARDTDPFAPVAERPSVLVPAAVVAVCPARAGRPTGERHAVRPI